MITLYNFNIFWYTLASTHTGQWRSETMKLCELKVGMKFRFNYGSTMSGYPFSVLHRVVRHHSHGVVVKNLTTGTDVSYDGQMPVVPDANDLLADPSSAMERIAI